MIFQPFFFFHATQVNVWLNFLLPTCHSKFWVQEPLAAMLLQDCWLHVLSGRSMHESRVIFLFWSGTPFGQWLECYFFISARFSSQRSKSLRMVPYICIHYI
jgi:hypothetical protein